MRHDCPGCGHQFGDVGVRSSSHVDVALAAERARIAAAIRAMREDYYEGASMDWLFASLLRVVEGG